MIKVRDSREYYDERERELPQLLLLSLEASCHHEF